MLEKFKQKFKDKNLYIFICTTLIFFGVFILKDYTVDSYLFFNETWKEPFLNFAGLGRLVSAIFWLILSGTNFNILYLASFIIAIIVTTLSCFELNKILSRDIKNEKIRILVSILTIINFSTLELYLFLEKGIMMLSILMVIYAVEKIEDALKGNKKAILLILIYMFIANCCYQGTVGAFLAIGSIYIIKNSKNIKSFIKNNILCAILYGIPAILNLLIAKFVFNTKRVGNNTITISEKIEEIFVKINDIMKNGFGVFTNYLIIIFIAIISVVFIIKTIQKKEKIANKINYILGIFYIIILCILSAVAPQIVQDYVYIVPRNVFPLAILIPVLMIYSLQKFENSKLQTITIASIGILMIVIQFYSFMTIIKGHYYTNMKDMEIANRIGTVVKNYEEETGENITKISIYKKKELPTEYKNVKHFGDGNTRAFYTNWGTIGILDTVLEKNLELSYEKIEEFEKYFENMEQIEFSEEQIKFEKDTIHLYIF